jgi:ABC-type nitrate/sulfonate/bicarbonate transport system substrate-binding protein
MRKAIFVLLALLLMGAAASFSWSSEKSEGGPEELPLVRVALIPFFDYQFWSVAEEFEWDTELGLDVEIIWLTQSGPSIQALANGSVDVINTCIVCNYPFYESVPNMVSFLTVNQFKGFAIIGRRGQSKTYWDFLDELGDPDKARRATLMQIIGKSFPMYTANYTAVMKGLLEDIGYTLDDVTLINFPDDEKAAIAMIGGTGDFYMGGLPSEINLIMNHGDDYHLLGGAEIMGAAGLWHSHSASTTEWLADNEDAALKIMAMSYRYNRYINEDPDAVLPIVVEAMNAHSGVATDEEEISFIYSTFLQFRNPEDEAKDTYNPNSPLYWKISADYFLERSAEMPAGAKSTDRNPVEEWFEKFLDRKDLLEWVNRPL